MRFDGKALEPGSVLPSKFNLTASDILVQTPYHFDVKVALGRDNSISVTFNEDDFITKAALTNLLAGVEGVHYESGTGQFSLKISSLTQNATILSDDDLIAISQNGTDKKTTLAILKAYISSTISSGSAGTSGSSGSSGSRGTSGSSGSSGTGGSSGSSGVDGTAGNNGLIFYRLYGLMGG